MGWLDWHILRRTPKDPKPTGRVIRSWEHKDSGEMVHIRTAYQKHGHVSVYGFMRQIPRPGDCILVKVKTGITKYKLIEVRGSPGPDNMFFGTAALEA